MNIITCPHCYIRVILMPDGACPSCREFVNETDRSSCKKTSILIRHGADLPPFCCQCGVATDRYVKTKHGFGASSSEGVGRFTSVLLLFVAPLLGLLAIASMRDSQRNERGRDQLMARVPQCRACADRGPLEIVGINTEEFGIRLIVHDDFRTRLTSVT